MQSAASLAKVQRSEAILAVADVPAAIAFYRDRLGFTGSWEWGDPPDFGGVEWGRANIMFSLAPELARRSAGNAHYFFVTAIDELYARHQQAQVEVVAPLRLEPWGLREYTIRDLNGYHLRFGEPYAPETEAAPLPAASAEVTLVERLPTLDEYRALVEAVGWTQFVSFDWAERALAGSLYSVVARDGDKTVGMARLVGDGAMFCYVQDVMVLPEYQRRDVGTQLVNAVVEHFRSTAAPRAFLGLFTGRGLAPFYEQWDFRGPEKSLYGMCLRK